MVADGQHRDADTSGLKLVPVPAAIIHKAWPHVWPMLEKVPQEEMGVGDILHHLREKNLQLWIVVREEKEIEGALLTEIIHHPLMSVVRVRMAAGRRAKVWWKLASEIVGPWAKAYGCSKVEVVGRPGWERWSGGRLKKVGVVLRGDI